MADCFMFGLKKQQVNKDKAMEIYMKAADLYQPEAVSTIAAGSYQYIASKCGLFCLDAIPFNKAHMWEHRDIKSMWFRLEILAVMEWITPFFLFQVEQAKKLGNWKLSDMVLDTLERRRTGQVLDMPFISCIKACDNSDCEVYVNQVIRVILCRRCLKQKYCSERCK